jgi:glyoxylase-like metal-dependent hydrolase (beta-lactamase superfamily II)
MIMDNIHCIDLDFSFFSSSIACYAIRYEGGVVLVDPGPESTLPGLEAGLAALDSSAKDVTHVLLTHIHLDHAGAAGWFAARGARIFVHPVGAPHLLDPEKLLASAQRIYGERMDELWGSFQPVPDGQLVAVADESEIEAGGLTFKALYTPGHADHHIAYLFQEACFSGDVGGVRMPGPFYLRLPFVPPETHLGKWRLSLERIRTASPRWIAPTHFGLYPDAVQHLDLAARMLDEVDAWLEKVMPAIPDVETLQAQLVPWLRSRGRAFGLKESLLLRYDQASPVSMGASALFRYWQKTHQPKM